MIQCLYCPDDYFLKKSIDSIISTNSLLQDNILFNVYNFTIYLQGYFGNDILYNKYYEIISKLDMKINIKIELKSSPNLGKSTAINNIIKSFTVSFPGGLEEKKEKKYILVMDSDIIINNIDFSKLINALETNKKIGLIAINQKEDNRHNNINNKILYTPDNEILLYSDKCIGVAGGCFFIKLEILIEFPYPNVGIYGMDDTIYHKTLFDNNYLVVIAKNMYVTHPFDYLSIEYNNWKLNRCLTKV